MAYNHKKMFNPDASDFIPGGLEFNFSSKQDSKQESKPESKQKHNQWDKGSGSSKDNGSSKSVGSSKQNTKKNKDKGTMKSYDNKKTKDNNEYNKKSLKELTKKEAEISTIPEEDKVFPAIEEAKRKYEKQFEEMQDYLFEYYYNESIMNNYKTLPPFERSDELVKIMKEYHSLTGIYQYMPEIFICIPAFILYLENEGVKAEMSEDICWIIETLVWMGGDYAEQIWPVFKLKLQETKLEIPNRNLFISHIGAGGSKVLVEAKEFGFIDRRLEHGITTLQRFLRCRKKNPITPKTNMKVYWEKFDKVYHDCTHVKDHYIHLPDISIGSTTHFIRGESTMGDGLAEFAVLRWNRKIIPQFIRLLSCNYINNNLDFTFSVGLQRICEELDDVIETKRDNLLSKSLPYLLDDDALTKISQLLNLRGEGRLNAWRDPKRDVLKFIRFKIDEPVPDYVEKKNIRGTMISASYLARLDGIPFSIFEEILSILPSTLAERGTKLVYDFSKVDPVKLSPKELRGWFLDLCIDNISDIASQFNCSELRLNDILKNDHLPDNINDLSSDRIKALEAIRTCLINAHTIIKSGKNLYSYKIWNKPVSVEGVNLVRDVEA